MVAKFAFGQCTLLLNQIQKAACESCVCAVSSGWNATSGVTLTENEDLQAPCAFPHLQNETKFNNTARQHQDTSRKNRS